MCPHPVPSNSYNICLPSSAVNPLQNTELFHLTSFVSYSSALFSPMGARQLFWNQSVPHSFSIAMGVWGVVLVSLAKSLSACPPQAGDRSPASQPAFHKSRL